MGRAGRGQHPVLERGDRPVADARLDQAGPHLRQHPPGLVARALGEFGGEQLGQVLLGAGQQRVLGGVVLLPVRARGEHDVQAGVGGDPGHPGRVAAQADRGGLDHGVHAGRAQAGRLLPAAPLVVEFVAGQQRGDLEQVLVVVGAAQRGGRHVPEHRADAHRTAAAAAASSSTVDGVRVRPNTSAITWDQPWMK